MKTTKTETERSCIAKTEEPSHDKTDFADDTPELEVSDNGLILGLIRSSIPKKVTPKKNGGSHAYRYKSEEKKEEAQRKKKWQSGYELSPHIAAVRYVRSERVKAGLPAEVKEELESIEEESVRREFRRLKSSRKMDAKDKVHAVDCKTIEEYLDTKTFTRRVANEMWADKVAKELVAWIKKPREDGRDHIKLTEFFREQGIYHRDFHRLSKKYPILEQAAEYAKLALGDVRERNILEGKWNVQAGMFMMGHYDEEWMAEMRRREEAKQKQSLSQTVDLAAIVRDTISPVAPTEEVRMKKEKDCGNRREDK